MTVVQRRNKVKCSQPYRVLVSRSALVSPSIGRLKKTLVTLSLLG